jgi:hypothetical protein
MDERKQAEVVNALRNARIALQKAEQAILNTSEPAAPGGAAAPAQQSAPPGESALLNLLLTAAAQRKQYEEQDEASFAVHLDELHEDLLPIVLKHSQLEVFPGSMSVKPQETVPALDIFNKILKCATETNIKAADLFGPHLKEPELKTWSDFDPTQDLLVVKYKTPAPVKHLVDAAALGAAVEAAKVDAGSVDRVVSALRVQHVEWVPFDKGALNNVITITDVDARWMAVVNLVAVGNELADQLSMLSAAPAPRRDAWWSAAMAAKDVPQCALEVVRGRRHSAYIKRDEVKQVSDWATKLPGWSDASTQPLVIRDVDLNDILAK